ncbi:MAG: CCA tRNA nucleotidyltransferase, partial [Alphaproteobacteria bacterium]
MTLSVDVETWFARPGARAVFDALQAHGGEVRFAGGCVRDALIGRDVSDLDLATDLLPQQVMAALESAGIAAKPTGIEHGTVMAVVDRTPYEITTLRLDVVTDGRHAKVAFTDDWAADAARRDFTINGLFADASGKVIDHVGGLDDIAAKQIRFIGDANARIIEDYLRILRFFRFQSQLLGFSICPEGLAAAAQNSAGLGQISAERIASELRKLLLGDQVVQALVAMVGAGVDRWVFQGGIDPQRIDLVGELAAREPKPEALRRLFVLLGADWVMAAATALKLSNRDHDRLLGMQKSWKNKHLFASNMHDLALDTALYLLGGTAALDGAVLADCAALADRLQARVPPKFPL